MSNQSSSSSQSLSSSLGSKYVTFVDKIDEDFNCTICLNVADEPSRCSSLCGAMFCGDCMKQALQSKKCCPACNKTKVTATKDVILRNQIMKQSVYCINTNPEDQIITTKTSPTKRKASRCSWIGKYDQLEQHLKECDYQKVKCSYPGCDIFIDRIELDRHKQSCLFQLKHCDYCKIQFNLKSLKDHLSQCPSRLVKCTCGLSCLAKNLNNHKTNDCPDGVVQCNIGGCQEKVIRKEYQAHLSSASNKHIQLLSSKVEELKTINAKNLSEIQSLQCENGELTDRLDGLSNENDTLTERLDSLSSKVDTYSAVINWKLTDIKAKMKEASKEEKIWSSREFDIYFNGHQKLLIQAKINKKSLRIGLFNGLNAEHKIDLSDTQIVISKDKQPDLSNTMHCNPCEKNERYTYDMTENMTPYIDKDCINVTVHLKLKVVDHIINLVDDNEEVEDEQDSDEDDDEEGSYDE